MNALNFANEREFVVVRIAGNGCPAGQDIAWMPPETELPFDLGQVEGEVGEDGYFTATNLNDGSGVWGWKFHDWRSNIIYAVWLRTDKEVWEKQAEEFGQQN